MYLFLNEAATKEEIKKRLATKGQFLSQPNSVNIDSAKAFTNKLEALEFISSNNWDNVTLIIEEPRLSASTAEVLNAAKLTKNSNGSSLKAFVSTQNTNSYDRGEWLACGITDFIPAVQTNPH